MASLIGVSAQPKFPRSKRAGMKSRTGRKLVIDLAGELVGDHGCG